MESFFSRYKNPLALMAILFIQIVALATQVKRPESSTGAAASGGTRLIRVWTVTAISPFERALVSTGSFIRRNFHSYIDLHNVRKQNQQLQEEVAQLKLEQVRLETDADQAKRLRTLLGFTQHYAGQLLPAQVIGTSGTETSHVIQIDKGSRNAHIQVDMPVITPDGVVGKVKDVFPFTSQVLLISDRYSGAGVILENSRLQSVLRGSPHGELHLSDIMSDEDVTPGEPVITSGGDGIFPKGLPVGTVSQVSPDRGNQPFLAVTVKPAANLKRLEEVLVVTKISQDGSSQSADAGAVRAADILSERLPSVPKPEDTKKAPAAKTSSSSPPRAAATSPGGAAIPASPAAVLSKVAPNALKVGDSKVKKAETPSRGMPGVASGKASHQRVLPPKAPVGQRELSAGTKAPAQASVASRQSTNKSLAQKGTVPTYQKPGLPSHAASGSVRSAASPVKKAMPKATPGASPSPGTPPAQSGAAGGPPR